MRDAAWTGNYERCREHCSDARGRRCRDLLRQPWDIRNSSGCEPRPAEWSAPHPLPARECRYWRCRRLRTHGSKPAATLLHLGPGLANGLANLHNARRACTPIVNLVGGHASFHERYADSPLASDIEGFARPVSAWVHRTANSLAAGADAAHAVEAALRPPGQIATLIVPADAAWDEAGQPAPGLPRLPMATVENVAIDRVASALNRCGKAAVLIRGDALRERGLTAAGRIAAKTGARLLYDTLVPRIQRGAGRVRAERVPYFSEAAISLFRDTDLLILVGTTPPVSLFASLDKLGWSIPEGCDIVFLSHEHEDGVSALEAVAKAIGAPNVPAGVAELVASLPTGESLTAEAIAHIVAYHLPENAIIVDETVSSGQSLHLATATSRPHDHLMVCGGSIGWALPASTGAAIACPGRKTICLHGDGGAAMALQALWTQARENLDVITVIYSNRSYAVVTMEMARAGFNNLERRVIG